MTTNWIESVYTQERSILTVSYLDVNTGYIVIETSIPVGYSARYETQYGSVLEIDMSDIVRLATFGSFIVTEYDTAGNMIGSAERHIWSYQGLIKPTSVFIPKCALTDNMNIAIMPPTMLLRSCFNVVNIQFELYGYDTYLFNTARVHVLPDDDVINFRRTVSIPNTADMLEFWHLNDINYYTIQLRDCVCEKRYAMVEWMSYTGRIRRNTFELVKVTTETTENVSIATIDNQYDIRKNRVDSMTLRLEGLDVYDLWYYADLITSSSVKVTIDGVHWYQVQVTTKKHTLPESDAGKFNTLEIDINYRKYDTI